MNKIHVLFVLFLIQISINNANAQSIDASSVFANAMGIDQMEAVFYEVEGYNIFVQSEKATFDEKGINKLKKKFSIDKKTIPIEDSSFPGAKMFVKTLEITSTVTESRVYYFFPEATKRIKVIGLITRLNRDEDIEKLFVRSILNKTIPEEVYTYMHVDSFMFAGRVLHLGPACRWMGVHNMQCPDMGQMNWSEFRTMDKAQKMIDAQMSITTNRQKVLGEVMQLDTVDILFEEVPVRAIKMKYKIHVPELILGGSNILIAYYVAAPVRNKFVGCVLSYYMTESKEEALPPLLREVMSLKN